MYIAYTEEQEALRQELRSYCQALLTPEIRERGARGQGRRRGDARGRAAHGRRRLARHRLAEGVRRPGALRRSSSSSSSTSRCARARRCRCSPINTVAPTIMQLRHRRAEGSSSCRRSCKGEIHFCDRLHRARRGHRPGLAEDARRPRRRRLRDQRPEDVHEPRAPTPTTSGSPCAPIRTRRSTSGISMIVVDRKASGIRVDPMYLLSSTTSTPSSSRTCACRPRTSSAASTRAGS